MAEATTNTTTIIARADQHDIDLHKASDRVNFGSIREPIDVPYLLGVQTDSFDWLIGNERWQKRVQEDLENGTNTVPHTSGLDEVFQEISPIENFAQTMSLTFSDPYFEEPRHTVQECKEKDYTYSAPLYVNAEFENGDTGEIKSQTVFMGDFPLQTPHGTFIIGGTERVIVSQLVRSPGVYFDRSQDRTSDKEVFGAKIIPSRGAWLEFEIDKRDVLGVRVDRKRKQSAIVFLMAIGMTKDEIADAFKDYPLVMDALAKETVQTQDEALTDLYRKIRPADTPTPEAGKNLLDSFYFNTKRYDLARVGRYKINRKLGLEKDVNDRSLSREDIIATIKYLVTLHAGETKFPGKRDGQDVDLRVDVDDIDHFGNRRIRQVGELIQNQLRTGLSRMERVVRERMTTQDPEAITPQSLINIRPVNATIKEFFGTSQLSQFMDQNNPLAGVTNKRRLSALGPGGLSRDRASMEVRDVHPSHFGRMCPIESPEGPNIGLIGSLATFGRVNPFGFIETPYRKVVNGHVTDEVEYMTADRDAEHVIAQANQELDENGNFVATEGHEYYDNWFIHPDASRDTLCERRLSNRLFVQAQPWDRNGVVGTIDAGVGLDLHTYSQFELDDYLSGHYTKVKKTSYFAYGSVNGKIKKYVDWGANIKFYPSGYRGGDINIGAHLALTGYLRGHPLILEGRLSMDRRSPNYWQENLFSNHYIWSTPLNKENETRFEVKFSIPDFAFEVGGWQGVVSDKIYYGADSNVAQHAGSVSLTSVYARKDFRLGGLHLDNRVLLQWSTDQEVVPVPLLSAFLSYYYEFWVVRDVLRLQIGLDGRYNTRYYAPGYNPALSVYYNQREVEVGNYPYMDAFVMAKWKRMRIFLKYQHVNKGLFGNGEYFSAAGYPLNPGMFKIGISWGFYD